MSVQTTGDSIELIGECVVEDAEVLLAHLLARPGAAVDWRACESAHTAVIQVLLVAKSRPVGLPAGQFLKEKILPLLDRAAT